MALLLTCSCLLVFDVSDPACQLCSCLISCTAAVMGQTSMGKVL